MATPVEVAVIGEVEADATQALLTVAQAGYHPHRLVAAGTGDVPPLLAHRPQVDGQSTVYVCVQHVCREPVVDAQALAQRLP
jgi:hypothetical protein